jgi:hypothetical protein
MKGEPAADMEQEDARGAKRSAWTIAVRWGPVVAWMAIIFYLSTHRLSFGLGGTGLADKWEHMAAYAVLGALCLRGFHASGGYSVATAAWCAVLGATAYGLMNEIVQIFVEDRHASALDAAVNVIGALVGAAAYIGLTEAAEACRRAIRRRA